jgi:hypothetical protein
LPDWDAQDADNDERHPPQFTDDTGMIEEDEEDLL